MLAHVRLLFIVLTSLEVVNTITNGRRVHTPKRYMVYFLHANRAVRKFDAWLCGGSIIHQSFILTAASCVYEVKRVYVISGYNKYVKQNDMTKDPCIMKTRRKVIQFCFPTKFNPQYFLTHRDYWNFGDICVAKLDRPLNFFDQSYETLCSYRPAPVRVNYYSQFLIDDLEVITLGWGHAEFYRPRNNPVDMNEEYLRYSSGRLTSRRNCLVKWPFLNNRWRLFKPHVEQFFLCVDKPGYLDENGHLETSNHELYLYCNRSADVGAKLLRNDSEANESYSDCLKRFGLRSGDEKVNTTGGFCQNDHGGPLVTWIGGVETVIGVVTMCPIKEDMRCHEPYLYTSTVCFNKVIACYLEARLGNSRRAMYCNNLMDSEAKILDTWDDELYNNTDMSSMEGSSHN